MIGLQKLKEQSNGSLRNVINAAAAVARMCPMEEFDDAFQESALAILQAPNVGIGVFRAKRDRLNRYWKMKRRQELTNPATWNGEGFQSCQFDPKLRTRPGRVEDY